MCRTTARTCWDPATTAAPLSRWLNERSEEYADFKLDDDGPTYAFLRHLGFEIQQHMGDQDENRWIIDQVMDKDGFDAYRGFAKAFRDLFD